MNLQTMAKQRKEITTHFMKRHNLKLNQFNMDNMKNTQLELDLLQEFKKAGCYVIPITNRAMNTLNL
jgi:hypothetical protein